MVLMLVTCSSTSIVVLVDVDWIVIAVGFVWMHSLETVVLVYIDKFAFSNLHCMYTWLFYQYCSKIIDLPMQR